MSNIVAETLSKLSDIQNMLDSEIKDVIADLDFEQIVSHHRLMDRLA